VEYSPGLTENEETLDLFCVQKVYELILRSWVAIDDPFADHSLGNRPSRAQHDDPNLT